MFSINGPGQAHRTLKKKKKKQDGHSQYKNTKLNKKKNLSRVTFPGNVKVQKNFNDNFFLSR
jgi:hypothetical protein